jgi:substrate-binding family protein
MYGKSDTGFPQRIVCLSSEHVEICYALGAGERVVGVPGTAHRPAEARDKPRIGGFTSFRADKIQELEPDLRGAHPRRTARLLLESPLGGRRARDHRHGGRPPRPRQAGP